MLVAKKLCVGMFTLMIFSVGCAETELMETRGVTSTVQTEKAEAAKEPKAVESLLIQFTEKVGKEGAPDAKVIVWEIRALQDQLKLYQGEQFIGEIKKAAWYQTVRTMLDVDKLQKYDGQRVTLENERAFWQEVRDRGLTSYGDAEVASRKIDETDGKLRDLLASVTYKRLRGLQSAYKTLNQAISGNSILKFGTGTSPQEGDLLVLLFDPFKG